MRKSLFLVIGILFARPGLASDHIDGPATTASRAADLTDLFAFPTPGRPGFVTIILDSYPLVPRNGRFSDKVNYTILVRRTTIRDSGGEPSFETGDEVALNCTFETSEVAEEQVVTCTSSTGASARSRYGVLEAEDRGNGFRLFAGMRADPFFLNTGFFSHAIDGRLDPPRDDNALAGANVMAIVIEIDLLRLYSDPPSLIAVAAETTTRDDTRAAARRLDRVGRPEITNVSLAARRRIDVRDAYNLDRPFQVPAAKQQSYRDRLAGNVAFYDSLDGRNDWTDADRDALAGMVAADFLVVDLTKPCAPQSFLEIERSVLRHVAHQTCGGRKPEDDIMDTLFTLYIAGVEGKPVRDGVGHPASMTSSRFPYLAPPDSGFWSSVRVFLGRKLLGTPDMR